MKNRFYTILIFMMIPVMGYSVNIGVETGMSYFQYAEVSTNNKDDLFKVTSILAGLTIGNDKFNNFIGVQVPLSLKFEDALGEDDNNYVSDFVYFGLNNKSSYNVFESVFGNLDALISLNYFIFRDHFDTSSTEYDFFTIGPGIGYKKIFNHNYLWDFFIGGEATVNFPMFMRTDREFLWSYSLYLNLGLRYRR